MPDDSDIVRIRIRIRRTDRERLGYAAWNAGQGSIPWLEAAIHVLAQTYPAPPAPPRERRPMSEVRAQRRQDLGGVSPYTAAITIIPKEQQ